MRQGVIIIHGARIPCRSNRYNDKWTSELQSHIIDSGRFHLVSRYSWSGGFLRSYLKKSGKDCAKHLMEVYESCDLIHIVGKSHGALVAESAIKLLQREAVTPQIGVLLRIATADSRLQIPLPNTCKVIDVVSSDDRLYRAGIAFGSIWKKRNISGIDIETVVVRGFSHRDFNQNKKIELNGYWRPSTFDLYISLLQPPPSDRGDGLGGAQFSQYPLPTLAAPSPGSLR